MKYKSDKICGQPINSTLASEKGKLCTVGAEYHYKGYDLCGNHFRKLLAQDYIAAHPECIRHPVEVCIGGHAHKITPQQLAQITQILRDSPQKAD
jgi:hypothetical protein